MPIFGDTYVEMYVALNKKIEWFMENYSPSTFTVSGTSTLQGNVTLGTDDSDVLVVNSQSTFNNGITADSIIVDTFAVRDNATIGQDDADLLTINSTSTFEGPVTLNEQVNVTKNIVLGTDTTNTVTATGIVTAPHFTIPLVTGNSLRLGADDFIAYHVYSSDLSGNIYESYPNSVFVKVLNSNITTMSIIYTSTGTNMVLGVGKSATFMKTSLTAYTLIQQET